MQDIISLTIDQLAELLEERGSGVRPQPGSRLQEDLALTSLNMISLLTSLCETLRIDLAQLSDVELANMQTVNDVAETLSLCAR